MEEINQIVLFAKDLILSLDQYRGVIEPVPNLIKELSNIEKVFIKIDVKMTQDELVFNLTKEFLAEANTCLSLLKETLTNIQTELNIFASHHHETFMDTIWNIFNQSQVFQRFQTFVQQVKDQCDHLQSNFLPILNAIITESFEREKITRSIRTLSEHDREKIRNLLLEDSSIMKLYTPKEGHSATADEKRVVSRASAANYDVVQDYYHIKWLQVLPHIWKFFPELTLGQIKYIYLTHSFFLHYHDDFNFINEKTVEECSKLQLYLEMTEEIPVLKLPDYEFIAQSIHQNKDLTMRGLIDLLNARFAEKRSFNFLLLLASELFSTKSILYENILRSATDEFPAEESVWPEGEIEIDWKVVHVVYRKHQLVHK